MMRIVRTNERGGMVIMLAFAMVMVTVCGLTAYYMATTEVTSSGTKFEKAKALYLAEGGLERAVTSLTSGMDNGWDDEIAGVDGQTGTTDDGILGFGSEVDCGAFMSMASNYNETSTGEQYLGHYDVRISDARRPGQQVGACNKVILSSTGVSSKDVKKRVEAEIEIFDLPLPPALIFMVGRYNETEFPDPDFSGQAFVIDGNDTDPDGTAGGGSSVPGLASNGIPAPIIAALKDNQKDQIMGTGFDASTSPITPSVQQTAEMANLTEIAQKLSGMADNVITPGTYASFTGYGTADDYEVTICNGDLHISGQMNGYGVLVVTGDFKLSGEGKWEGYIICLNHAGITGGGNGFHLFGCMMIGNSSGLDYLSEFKITGSADLVFSWETVNKARTDVRTVQVNYWRTVAAN